MNLTQLEKEYDRHHIRIVNRSTNPPGLTHARKLGIAYYTQAANAVMRLNEYAESSNEGFEMRSAAQLAPEKMSLAIPEEAK